MSKQVAQVSGVIYLIFRASWTYVSRGQNFMHLMLRLAKQKEELKIVNDQIGEPCWVRLIFKVSLHSLVCSMSVIGKNKFESRRYNLVVLGQTSWQGFAQKVIEIAREKLSYNDSVVRSVKSLVTSESPTPAKRPLRTIEQYLDLFLPDCDHSLELCTLDL